VLSCKGLVWIRKNCIEFEQLSVWILRGLECGFVIVWSFCVEAQGETLVHRASGCPSLLFAFPKVWQLLLVAPPSLLQLDAKVVKKIRKKVTSNYVSWCNFIRQRSNLEWAFLCFPSIKLFLLYCWHRCIHVSALPCCTLILCKSHFQFLSTLLGCNPVHLKRWVLNWIILVEVFGIAMGSLHLIPDKGNFHLCHLHRRKENWH